MVPDTPHSSNSAEEIPFTGRTAVSFLIGSPIAQVLAPGRLTARMRAVGYDGILVPLEVPRERLASMLETLKQAPNVGAILVTLPHKFGAAQACDRLSPAARKLNAINAMRRDDDGSWNGANFDGEGMIAAIRSLCSSLEGKEIRMAGAGAAATSIAVSAMAAGASKLIFHDPDPSAADALQSLLEQHFPARSERVATLDDAPAAEILINASPCGLRSGDPLPLSLEEAAPGTVVADVITDPLETPLLAAASGRGLATVTGGDMLEGQLGLLLDFIRYGESAASPGREAGS